MLKQYLHKQNIKISDLSKMSGIPYSTLSDLVHNVKKIDDCKVGIIQNLSKAMGMNQIELYNLCVKSYEDELKGIYSEEKKDICKTKSSGVDVNVVSQYGSYYACFQYKGKSVSLPVAATDDFGTNYLDSLVEWTVDDYIKQEEGWVL